MAERNAGRSVVTNAHHGYEEAFRRRGLKKITQHAKFNIPSVPEDERIRLNQSSLRHTFQTGDKLYKIAYKHYGDTKYWWVLAWWNRKPTDFHCKIGDTIFVPFPLKDVLHLATRQQ